VSPAGGEVGVGYLADCNERHSTSIDSRGRAGIQLGTWAFVAS
jgi:hypothetical protein